MGSDALVESNATGTIINEEYVFFGGARIARIDRPSGATHYYFSDHLGSANVVAGVGSLTPEEESDYYPFGGERPIITGPNTYKFAGKERDGESGLDYFGARHFSNNIGRFVSPDEPFADQEALNPQTWNLYSYTRNNPVRFVDPNGRETQDTLDPQATQEAGQAIANAIVGSAKGLWNALASTANGVNAVFINGPSIAFTGHAAIYDVPEAQYSNTTQAIAGTLAPLAVAAQGMVGEAGAATEAATTRSVGAAASDGPTVQANRAVGNTYRDEVADSLKAAGREVKTEVTKQTPFGTRRVDIEVSHNGKTLGGVETKTGNSPYTAAQRSKDTYLKQKGYPVNVVRKPKEP